jgi:P-type Cu2+ transporter
MEIGPLRKVLHSEKDFYLSQGVKLVKEAQDAKSNTQLLADEAAQ